MSQVVQIVPTGVDSSTINSFLNFHHSLKRFFYCSTFLWVQKFPYYVLNSILIWKVHFLLTTDLVCDVKVVLILFSVFYINFYKTVLFFYFSLLTIIEIIM